MYVAYSIYKNVYALCNVYLYISIEMCQYLTYASAGLVIHARKLNSSLIQAKPYGGEGSGSSSSDWVNFIPREFVKSCSVGSIVSSPKVG